MMVKAKPFIKWAGGKGQLLEQLEALLPADFDVWEKATYIEPFVGGGAMLFYMLQTHSNIKRAVINDMNKDLIGCYRTIRNTPHPLVASLKEIQKEYLSLSTEGLRKDFFLAKREKYNRGNLDDIENTTLFIFLNRTCFNGLYRVNKSGLFNVPFGKYSNPTICDENTIFTDSELLQRVEILHGDFENTLSCADSNTLFYFDPPYRPLSNTSSFNDYCKYTFNDESQIRLKTFCDKIHGLDHTFMLSNSDCFAKNEDRFFDNLFINYYIDKVFASRNINSNASKRGKLTEILVHNYPEVKGRLYT